MAQLVERWTESSAPKLTDPGSTPRHSTVFFLPESAFSADSLTVSVQPPAGSRNHQLQSVRALKIPKQRQPYYRLDTQKYCTYLQKWVALLLRLL